VFNRETCSFYLKMQNAFNIWALRGFIEELTALTVGPELREGSWKGDKEVVGEGYKGGNKHRPIRLSPKSYVCY